MVTKLINRGVDLRSGFGKSEIQILGSESGFSETIE
jgi:hypothetical protein